MINYETYENGMFKNRKRKLLVAYMSLNVNYECNGNLHNIAIFKWAREYEDKEKITGYDKIAIIQMNWLLYKIQYPQ